MLGERVGQRAALVHLLTDLRQHHLELLVVRLLGKRAQRLGERNPRLEQGGELPREGRHLLRAGPARHPLEVDFALEEGDLLALGVAAGGPPPARARQHFAVLGDEDAVLAQRLAQALGPVGVARPGHRFAGAAQTFPGVNGHALIHVLGGDHQDLGGGGHSGQHLLSAVLAQRPHPR